MTSLTWTKKRTGEYAARTGRYEARVRRSETGQRFFWLVATDGVIEQDGYEATLTDAKQAARETIERL